MIRNLIARFFPFSTASTASEDNIISNATAAKPITRYSEVIPTLKPIPRQSIPKLSFIVIVHRMPAQAVNTLRSLSRDYQLGAEDNDYEVIVVENESDRMLNRQVVEQFGSNFRYFARSESSPTPVNAINFGVSHALGTHVAIMVDGARMVTPGVVQYGLAALHLADNVVVSVPGYHLGRKPQPEAVLEGYDEQQETKLLEAIQWFENGYRLFDIACLSGTSSGGFYKPIGESNCLMLAKACYSALGGCDARFESHGGGLVNLDLYKRVCDLDDTTLVLLHGEGTFHQFHGGVTTSGSVDRSSIIQEINDQYVAIRGERFSPPQKRAIFFGPIYESVLRFVAHSANKVIQLNSIQNYWDE